MADEIIETTRPAEHVTIVKERGSGMGGMMVALLALVVIAVVAFWALDDRKAPADPSDASIAAAADKVGGAAEKVGNAAEEAVKKIN